MSPAEILAPFFAIPLAVGFVWLALGEFIFKRTRARAVKDWSSNPVANTLVIGSGLACSVFLLWIGTWGAVGTVHAFWVAVVLLTLGFLLHKGRKK